MVTKMQFTGGKNFRASMISAYEENGKAVFYVRPFSEELKKDLDQLMADAEKNPSLYTKITVDNGTYKVASTSPFMDMDFFSFWGILFRRFMSESKRVCLDPVTEEKYYVVIFSNKFIEPCARKLAV